MFLAFGKLLYCYIVTLETKNGLWKLLSVICYLYRKKNRFRKLSTVTLGDDVIDLSCDILLLYRLHPLSKSSKETFEIVLLIRSFLTRREQTVAPESFK